MSKIVLVLGAAFVLFGAFAVVLPRVFRDWTGTFRSPAALRVVLLVRILVGLLLLLAAPYCRFTIFLQVFGALAVLAGAVMPMIGRARSDRLFDWWAGRSDGVVRGMMIVPVVMGAVLILAAL